MLGILSWCVFGLLVGLVSRLLTPGHSHLGLLGTMVLGIAGSLMGGFLSNLIFANRASLTSFQPAGFIGAVIGGVIVLLIAGKLRAGSNGG